MSKQKAIKLVKAVLTTNISYFKKGQEITIEKDTEIFVDLNESIALVNNDHMDIEEGEYRLTA